MPITTFTPLTFSPPALDTRRRHMTAAIALALLATLGPLLQGCGTMHGTAEWASKHSYLAHFRFVPPGQPTAMGALNSCEVPGLPAKLQCNGNGVCKEYRAPWAPVLANASSSIKLCQCYIGWADPECRTERKSQQKAYFLSLFLGFLGADRFYIGEFMAGFGKLSTLGGFGFWWVYDIVRIGTAPVYAENYRLAGDLDHLVFVISSLSVFVGLGYVATIMQGNYARGAQRKKKLLVKAEEEFFKHGSAVVEIKAMDQVGQPSKSSWGTPTFIGPGYGTTASSEGNAGGSEMKGVTDHAKEAALAASRWNAAHEDMTARLSSADDEVGSRLGANDIEAACVDDGGGSAALDSFVRQRESTSGGLASVPGSGPSNMYETFYGAGTTPAAAGVRTSVAGAEAAATFHGQLNAIAASLAQERSTGQVSREEFIKSFQKITEGQDSPRRAPRQEVVRLGLRDSNVEGS